MLIGKIVKSNSHTDYICQIYGPGELERSPVPEDYSFGTFVQAELEGDRWLVGLVYDTVLFNPDFGRLGPRLSPQSELAVFSPDYLDEKAILVGVVAIGLQASAKQSSQGVPPVAAHTDALVERMTEEQIKRFHRSEFGLQLAYMPVLLTLGSPLALHLLRQVLVQLVPLFPEHTGLLNVLEEDLSWKTQVVPLGGAG